MNGATTQQAPATTPAAQAIQQTKRPIPFLPATIDEAWRIATMLSDADIVPDDLRGKPNNVIVILMTGHELGLSPMQSLRQVYVVKGKPYIAAQLKLALVKNSPECLYFRCVATDAKRAVFETERRGEGKTTLEFTVEQALRAGLLPGKADSNWAKYPDVMLRWRAASQLADLVYSDVVGGIGTHDEKDELPPVRVPEKVLAPAPPQKEEKKQAEPVDAELVPEPKKAEAPKPVETPKVEAKEEAKAPAPEPEPKAPVKEEPPPPAPISMGGASDPDAHADALIARFNAAKSLEEIKALADEAVNVTADRADAVRAAYKVASRRVRGGTR